MTKLLLTDTLDRILEADPTQYHERAWEYGERAWRVRGQYADVIYWDVGNTWCDIIAVLPKKGREKWLLNFFRAVEASKDEEEMDDSFLIRKGG